MYDETINDDVEFDRLVDGELTADERRRLLESLDQRPDGWRRCALAFLEAQSFGEEFGDLVRPHVKRIGDAKAVGAGGSARERTTFRMGARWLALAATVLFAFTLGLLHRERTAPIAGGVSPNEGEITVINPPSAPGLSKVKASDALTLWVRDDKGQARPLLVPLVDADPVDHRLGTQFRSGVPAEVRSRLQDRGFHVQSKQRYAPFMLENGQPMFLPVEDTQIMPVRQNVY